MDFGMVFEKVLCPLLRKLREKSIWKNMFLDNGESILSQEHDLESEIFSQLNVLFSKEQLTDLAKTVRNFSGYDMENQIKSRLEGFFEGYHVEETSRNRYIQEFIYMLKNDIKEKTPDIFNQMYLKDFREESIANQKELISTQNVIMENQAHIINSIDEISDIKNLYMTIDEVNIWLKENTSPSIGLDFFDYEEKQFVEEFKDSLSKNEIYVKGKTREEVVYYILTIIKNSNDNNLASNTLVINSLDNWNKLKGKITGFALIPNFNASEVEIIPKNRNIIVFGEEDFIGKKTPIILKNRIRNNMYDKLKNSGVDFEIANKITNESNGLFSVFKRIVFKGKLSKPRWEEKSGRELLPALLLGKWTDKEGDRSAICEFANKEYDEYLQSINIIIGGEDPFILKINSYSGVVYKIANVEESWEILFNLISDKDIKKFKDLVLKIILSIDPIFDLDPSQHFYASLSIDKPKYSFELKSGIIRSLIMLAIRDNKSNNFHINSTQYFVDSIIEEILININSSKEWFGISQLLVDMVEASPETVLSKLEEVVKDEKSSLWELFEKNEASFTGRNYYTHILWALEKLLCMGEYVARAINVLAKLSERKIHYNLSNSPIATLKQVFCAWMHEINLNINEKIQLAEMIIQNYTIGWSILEQILPSRASGVVYSSMSKPKYRTYNLVEELKFQQQILNTYKGYLKIAIKYANNDLSKWSLIFKDCFFFEFELEKEVFHDVNIAISNCQADEEKYKFSKQVRETIYHHRYHINANWAMKKEYADKLETEVFNKIRFINNVYNYLYLFNSYTPEVINPEPYCDNFDFDKQREITKKMRIEAIEALSRSDNFDCIDLINKIDESSNGDVGAIIAEKLHNNEANLEFVLKIAELKKINILRSYIHSIYLTKGNRILKEMLSDQRIKALSIEIQYLILSVADIDIDFLNFIDKLDEELKKNFWKNIRYFRGQNDKDIFERVVKNMMNYYNYGSVLEIVNCVSSLSVEYHIDILEKILNNQKYYTLKGNDQYYIEESFQAIYKEYYTEKKEFDRILQLEIGYVKVLSRSMEMKYLRYALRTDPNFLADLIKMAYKSLNDENKIISDEAQRMANVAYEILHGVKFCPCVTDGGIIQADTLNKWVESFLRLVDENNQSDIGRNILGKCLANSPIGCDNVFPHEAVRTVIENNYTKHLDNGFHVEINNQRGVYWGTNGAEEKEIADKYLAYANALKITAPKTSKILLGISKDYQRESKLERERAENGF